MSLKKINHLLRYGYLSLLLAPTLVSAQTAALDNLKVVGDKAYGTNGNSDIKLTVAAVVQIILGFIGWIFFILILWSGIQWMISGGNEKKVEDAKKRIVSATIGLVIVFLSYAIARFISSSLSQAAGQSPQ